MDLMRGGGCWVGSSSSSADSAESTPPCIACLPPCSSRPPSLVPPQAMACCAACSSCQAGCAPPCFLQIPWVCSHGSIGDGGLIPGRTCMPHQLQVHSTLRSTADYEQFLTSAIPSLPIDAVRRAAPQLAECPVSNGGFLTRCSKLSRCSGGPRQCCAHAVPVALNHRASAADALHVAASAISSHPCAPPSISRPCSGRVVLVGDAAHSVYPSLGQGANAALEGAATLAAVVQGRAAAAVAAAAACCGWSSLVIPLYIHTPLYHCCCCQHRRVRGAEHRGRGCRVLAALAAARAGWGRPIRGRVWPERACICPQFEVCSGEERQSGQFMAAMLCSC